MTNTPTPAKRKNVRRKARRYKVMPCRGCGKDMTVGAQTVNQPRCIECGISAGTRAMIEMHNKTGPTYGRYVMGMHLYAERIARSHVQQLDAAIDSDANRHTQ